MTNEVDTIVATRVGPNSRRKPRNRAYVLLKYLGVFLAGAGTMYIALWLDVIYKLFKYFG